jgi:hypothetical protein
MINEANTLDLDDLDDIQEESITESPEIEESHDYGDEEQTYNNDDNFDLTKELLNL